jgi:hypothetical protein
MKRLSESSALFQQSRESVIDGKVNRLPFLSPLRCCFFFFAPLKTGHKGKQRKGSKRIRHLNHNLRFMKLGYTSKIL